ncbi:AAA family ATPase [Nocardioides sp. KIGAM211]|uniref:AAA family ATPase n=1 Tax=Nocardioides luti TaxID=2761101 RepID=A0A7X0RI22_9ACTN|nr:adenylate/guanylate cyclase domain-containing protein [Nocardioides luti]MBB6628713.1 AAA family ATPase [Nocardioides luti]
MVDERPSDGGDSCARCGTPLTAGARFCASCGTPVAAPVERETRRTVTLLFTDVTGSTALGEQLDPEAYRGVMGRYFDAARTAVERHGGTVEKFVGDAVLAVFGVPEVHEDDALRAVRAAAELNAAVAALSERLAEEIGVRLVIRTGVNTGSVVTGAARAGGSFATGDAVNTAARLEQAAAPGEILLGAGTHALVRDAVDAVAVDPVTAKGKAEPVPAYRLVAVRDVARGRRRRDDRALVGRDRETRALDDALERTLSSGRSHLVTVIGPAGIGKSRLVTDFLTRIGDRAGVAAGRCVSYGAGITYWPLVQALREAAGLTGTESDELTRHALARALAGASDADQVVDVLMPLLGKAGTAHGSDDTAWAVRRLLEELATRRPLVLTVDDLHWAEPTLLELLERVRDEVADLPLLLVCQARPELLEDHPTWGSGALNSLTFGLDPLTERETDESVASLLGADLPGGLGEAVAAWSGGNPLFVEEIVAHLVESGVLRRDDGGSWLLAGEVHQDRLPPTVSALLASRLGRLPVAERELLERVSVVGLEFTADDASLLADPGAAADLPGLLAALGRRDLLRRMRSSAGETWAFKHILVRDAAYDALAKSLRADLHERFADGMATSVGEGGGERLAFVAHHLEQAARYRRELAGRSPLVDALVTRAVEALVEAAHEARDREEMELGLQLLDRALALAPPLGADRRLVLENRAHLQADLTDYDGLAATLDAFEASLDDHATPVERAFLHSARLEVAIGTSQEVDPVELDRAGALLADLARTTGQTSYLVHGLRGRSAASTVSALWVQAAAVSEEAMAVGRPADVRNARSLRGASRYFGEMPLREVARQIEEETASGDRTAVRHRLRRAALEAIVAAADMAPDAAVRLAEAQAVAEELIASGKRLSQVFLIDAYHLHRDLDAAIAYTQVVCDNFREIGDTGHASTYVLMQAAMMLERGDDAAEVLPLVEEGARYTARFDVLSTAYLATCRAVVAARSGDLDLAWTLTQEALAAVDRTDQLWQQAELRRFLAEIPRRRGEAEREAAMLRVAVDCFRTKEIRTFDAELRARLDELGDLDPARQG